MPGRKRQFGLKFDYWQPTDIDWQGRFGEPSALFDRLHGLGVRFVELAFDERADLELLARTGQIACDQGLGCSLHPYVERELAPEVFDADRMARGLEAMLQVGEELAARSGQEVTIVFHGGLAHHGPFHRSLAEARERTRAFFGWLDAKVSACEGVSAFGETQMPHDGDPAELIRLGDTYDTCLDLLAGTRLGVCWDLGHTYLAAEYGRHPVEPGEAFLRRVGHVHAHDVIRDAEGKLHDHQALGKGICPWARYAQLLADHAYDGRILHEVPLAGCRDEEDLAWLVRPPLARLREALLGRPG
jgi:sugar phosphate isomerase/epimerase